MIEEEFNAQIKELTEKLEKSEKEKERLSVENEAAQSLLKGIELSNTEKNRMPSGNLRDLSGNSNFNTLMEDANKNTKEKIEEEIDVATKEILGKFSDEQLGEPATIRAIISEYGKRIGTIAYRRATANSIEVFQKAVDMKSRIDYMIGDWRIKHPELANKEMEDLVEAYLLRKVANDPANRNKALPELLEIATGMVLEFLDKNKEEGRVEEREKNKTDAPLTLSPRKSGGGGTTKKKEDETPMTQEESAARFLEMRKKMAEKRAWSGRPS